MKPTKPNQTGKATASDVVHTNPLTAEWIMKHYAPHIKGSILEPCAGNDIFFNLFNGESYRCEILDGSDFFDWRQKVDWIVTNPPYSIYDKFLAHCFEVADNVVLLVPIAKAFKSNKVQRLVLNYGGLKELVYMGGGSRHGFAFGFPVGCLYYKRGYKGDCKIIDIVNSLDELGK